MASSDAVVRRAYGMYWFFVNIIHNIFLIYYVDVFISVYKIDKLSFWIGELVFMVWNALNDPLFGWLTDSQLLGKGHRAKSDIVNARIMRLRKAGPLLSLAFALLWFNTGYPAIQFVVCLLLYDTFLTIADLQYNALLADLASSTEARSRLNASTSFWSALSSVFVFVSYKFWRYDSDGEFVSFQAFCLVVVVFCCFGTYFSSKYLAKYAGVMIERTEKSYVEPFVVPQNTLLDFIYQLKSQNNFLWFSLINLIQVFHCHANSNLFPFVLDNLLGSEQSSFGALLLTLSFVAPHLNNIYFMKLCSKYGTYRIVQYLFAFKLILAVCMLIAGHRSTLMLCIFIASNRIFTEGLCKILNLVISELVDEDAYINKRSQPVPALIFGASAFMGKPGQSLAPLLVVSYLDDKSSVNFQELCFAALVGIPILCGCLQLLIWTQYTLKGSKLRTIQMRLPQHTIPFV